MQVRADAQNPMAPLDPLLQGTGHGHMKLCWDDNPEELGRMWRMYAYVSTQHAGIDGENVVLILIGFV